MVLKGGSDSSTVDWPSDKALSCRHLSLAELEDRVSMRFDTLHYCSVRFVDEVVSG